MSVECQEKGGMFLQNSVMSTHLHEGIVKTLIDFPEAQVELLKKPEATAEYAEALKQAHEHMICLTCGMLGLSREVMIYDFPRGGTPAAMLTEEGIEAWLREQYQDEFKIDFRTVSKDVQKHIRDQVRLLEPKALVEAELFSSNPEVILIPESFINEGETIEAVLEQLLLAAELEGTINQPRLIIVMVPITRDRGANRLIRFAETLPPNWKLQLITARVLEMSDKDVGDHGDVHKELLNKEYLPTRNRQE